MSYCNLVSSFSFHNDFIFKHVVAETIKGRKLFKVTIDYKSNNFKKGSKIKIPLPASSPSTQMLSDVKLCSTYLRSWGHKADGWFHICASLMHFDLQSFLPKRQTVSFCIFLQIVSSLENFPSLNTFLSWIVLIYLLTKISTKNGEISTI